MKVGRTKLLDTLQKVRPAMAAASPVPELTHLWFDGVSVSAHDGGLGIKVPYESELHCGVPGAALIGLLKTSLLSEVELVVDGDALELRLGRSKSRLVTLPTENRVWRYPDKPPRKAPTADVGPEFMEALRRSLFVKASPATRVEHHGVLVEQGRRGLDLYATDSATVVRTVAPAPTSGGLGDERAILPYAFATQLSELSPEGVELVVAEDFVAAYGENAQVFTNRLDMEDVPDIKAVVSKHIKDHPDPVALPAGLRGALERAQVLAGDQEPFVVLAVSKQALELAGSFKLGELDERLKMEGDHEAAEIIVDAGRLVKGLVHAEELSITDKSLQLRGDGYLFLIAAHSDK